MCPICVIQIRTSSSSVMSRLFSKAFLEDYSLSEADFERINLVCLSSFAFGIVCSCLPWGSEILEKNHLLRMAAIKFTLVHYSCTKSW